MQVVVQEIAPDSVGMAQVIAESGRRSVEDDSR